MRTAAPVLLALLCACVLTGCGSSYTKHDFVARADAICASAVSDARAIPPPILSGTGPAQLSALAHYLAVVVPIYELEARQLRELKRPQQSATDRVELSRFLAAVSEAASEIRNLAAAAERQDAQGVTSAEATLQANEAGSLASRYGVRSCGAPSATVQ